MAAVDSPIPVRVVDTLKVTTGTGLAVDAAVLARDAGGDADAVEAATLRAAREGSVFFILDTLEYLVKGGRSGKATGLAASMLNIKLILTVNERGIIEPFKKVKGFNKAVTELAAHVAADSSKAKIRLSIFHTCNEELADRLKTALDAAGAYYELQGIHLVGSVIGTYAGPNSLGCAYYPKA